MALRRTVTPIHLNLAPMVDVMMCLLIFFMMATRMVEQEMSAIDLPAAQSVEQPDYATLDRRFVVNIRRADGPNAGPVYLVKETALPPDELMARLEAAHRADPAVHCVVRADRALAFHDVETVLAGCLGIGIEHVSFSVVESQR